MSGGRVELGPRRRLVRGRARGLRHRRSRRSASASSASRSSWRSSPGCGRRRSASRSTYAGRHYPVVDSPALPKPVQRPARRSSSAAAGRSGRLALAARYAAEFNLPFAPARARSSSSATACARRARPSAATRPRCVYSAALVAVLRRATRPRSPAGRRRSAASPTSCASNGAAGTVAGGGGDAAPVARRRRRADLPAGARPRRPRPPRPGRPRRWRHCSPDAPASTSLGSGHGRRRVLLRSHLPVGLDHEPLHGRGRPSARPGQVDWKFICLRMVNETKDYDREFPAGYVNAHGGGRRMLRIAAAAGTTVATTPWPRSTPRSARSSTRAAARPRSARPTTA